MSAVRYPRHTIQFLNYGYTEYIRRALELLEVDVTYQARGKIDYKQLRRINPEAARRAVLEYLKTNNHNMAEFIPFRPVFQKLLNNLRQRYLRGYFW